MRNISLHHHSFGIYLRATLYPRMVEYKRTIGYLGSLLYLSRRRYEHYRPSWTPACPYFHNKLRVFRSLSLYFSHFLCASLAPALRDFRHSRRHLATSKRGSLSSFNEKGRRYWPLSNQSSPLSRSPRVPHPSDPPIAGLSSRII